MAAWTRDRRLEVALLLVLASPGLAVSPGEDWYPADITPPAGTQYPCALTPLPRELPGIPSADRRFINHTYAMILKATQTKLVLLKALQERGDRKLDAPLSAYLRTTDEAVRRIEAEPIPKGLSPFSADVVSAIRLQSAFFRRAVTARQRGTSLESIFGFPEARTASNRLLAAWSKMEHRYNGAWTPATKDSIYHHLCALDLF